MSNDLFDIFEEAEIVKEEKDFFDSLDFTTDISKTWHDVPWWRDDKFGPFCFDLVNEQHTI